MGGVSFYVKKLFLVKMVFSDLVYKSDNTCEHNYELKKLGNSHGYHLPFGRNRLPLFSTHAFSIAWVLFFVNCTAVSYIITNFNNKCKGFDGYFWFYWDFCILCNKKI